MHSSKERALRWPLRAVRSRTVQTTLQGQPRNPSIDLSSAYALYFMSPWKTVLLVFKITSIQFFNKADFFNFYKDNINCIYILHIEIKRNK